jgi:hypothetical protein
MKGHSTKRQKEIARHMRAMAPMMPLADFTPALETAIAGHLRHLPPSIAAWQAITTRARHAHSDYDALLKEGYDRESARHFCLDAMNECLADWGCGRRVSAEEDDAMDMGR